ncbi:hypothetical protein MaudCBS49596_001588 [Microsporum audouinii]
MLPVTPTRFAGVGPIIWEDHGPKIQVKDPLVATILRRVCHDHKPLIVACPGVLYRDLQRAFVHPDTTSSEKDTLVPLILNTKSILQLELSNLRREHGRGICDFNSAEVKQRYWSEAIYQHYGKACVAHVVGGNIRPHDVSCKDSKSHETVFLNGLSSSEAGLRLFFSLKYGNAKYDYTLFTGYDELAYVNQLGVLFPMDCIGRRTVVASPLYFFPMPDAEIQGTVHVGGYSEVKWRIIRDDGVETRSGSFPSKLLLPHDEHFLQKIDTGRVAMLHLHPSIVGDDIQVVREGTSTTRVKHEYFWVGYLVSSPSPWLEKAFTVGAPLFIRLLASSSSMHTAEILKEADEQLGENFFLGQLEEGDRPAYNLNHGKPGEPHAGAKRFFLKARRPETQATYDFATTSVISGVPHYLLGDRVRDNQEI